MNNQDPARVNHFTFLTFVFVLVAILSAIHGMRTWDSYGCYWFGLCAAALLAQLMLLNRKRRHDDLCEPRQMIIQRPVEPIEPERQIMEQSYRPQIQNQRGDNIRYGKFSKTANEWAELARVLFANQNRVVRDVVAQAKVFTNITAPGTWNAISREFERLGWSKNGMLTENGIAWFEDCLNPPTPTD